MFLAAVYILQSEVKNNTKKYSCDSPAFQSSSGGKKENERLICPRVDVADNKASPNLNYSFFTSK